MALVVTFNADGTFTFVRTEDGTTATQTGTWTSTATTVTLIFDGDPGAVGPEAYTIDGTTLTITGTADDDDVSVNTFERQ